MRQLLEPRLVNDPSGDPGLYVDLLGERRALLFDLGDLAALPPRKLLRISHVFVSHTHVDHFVGFDTLLRVVLGRKDRIVLAGGPGFVDQVGHRLRAYTWNVVHRYEVPLELEVHEFAPDGSARQARFSSRSGFAREGDAPLAVDGDVLHDEPLLRVRGRFVDHEMPCLAFAVEEKARARVAKDRLAALGFGTGAWLRELKRALLAGAPPATPVDVRWRDRDGEHAERHSVGELSAVVLDVAPGQRIGYVTDLRFTDANRRELAGLLGAVDRLFIETPFLDEDAAQAARKNHLTARQAGQIARDVGAKCVVPFHFSPRYASRYGELAAEARYAWRRGAEAPDETEPEAGDDGPWTRALR
jgi:ribonuclease Z